MTLRDKKEGHLKLDINIVRLKSLKANCAWRWYKFWLRDTMSKNVFDIKPDSQIPPNDQQPLPQNYPTGNDIQTVKGYVYNNNIVLK